MLWGAGEWEEGARRGGRWRKRASRSGAAAPRPAASPPRAPRGATDGAERKAKKLSSQGCTNKTLLQEATGLGRGQEGVEGGAGGGNARHAAAQQPLAPPPRPRAPHVRGSCGAGRRTNGKSRVGANSPGKRLWPPKVWSVMMEPRFGHLQQGAVHLAVDAK